MSDPEQEQLDQIEEDIEKVRREAVEHGTIPPTPSEPSPPDPDADGEIEGTRVQPPG